LLPLLLLLASGLLLSDAVLRGCLNTACLALLLLLLLSR
jgi:hypothetical protein